MRSDTEDLVASTERKVGVAESIQVLLLALSSGLLGRWTCCYNKTQHERATTKPWKGRERVTTGLLARPIDRLCVGLRGTRTRE